MCSPGVLLLTGVTQLQLVHVFLKDTLPSAALLSGCVVGLSCPTVKVMIIALSSFTFWEDVYTEGCEICCCQADGYVGFQKIVGRIHKSTLVCIKFILGGSENCLGSITTWDTIYISAFSVFSPKCILLCCCVCPEVLLT